MMRLITSFAAASLALALMAGPALAQQGMQKGTMTATPAAPGAPAPAPAVPLKQVAPSHLAIAKAVVTELGIGRSFSQMTGQILGQAREIGTTRPELKDDIEQIIQGMQPSLDLQQQQMLNAAGLVFANFLSEAELKELDTFFRTPTGMKYVQTQPQIMDSFVGQLKDWSDNLAKFVFVRVQAELSKRGKQF